ncbi:hypothetical protein Tc00.1047053506965.110 [Trypanosoma cruzi]|uniref:Uncharacterized protein n=1 Tax=Trypanosoma cruzi (strain CL Brener) TaxID=353153 RepID=Q4DIF0_TRYCC|nr:hypothetical protein Tc00.1047053506965.110 [Trypanosoma cruzi]EAN92300.1 hypothetical protein Tc00.1047053506965.110 [Trypanosoma cruzi]|eukprot:XP_814151.1 hypothetical protein [Trypanosoma cruzi strain CL Brener]
MAGNFGAASWMDEDSLARVAAVVLACSVCVWRQLGVLDMYLVMRMRWLCRWMCRVLRVTAACAIACVCVCGSGRSFLLPVLRLSMRVILSVALMCACMAGMVSWVLCAMWPMRCTHVATVLPAVQRRRKGPPLPSR